MLDSDRRLIDVTMRTTFSIRQIDQSTLAPAHGIAFLPPVTIYLYLRGVGSSNLLYVQPILLGIPQVAFRQHMGNTMVHVTRGSLSQLIFFDIVYSLRSFLTAYDLQDSIRLRRTSNKDTRIQPVECKVMILARQSAPAALLFERLNITSHSTSIGRSSHAGCKYTTERLS